MPIAEASLSRIDARRWFGAEVEACLFRLTLGHGAVDGERAGRVPVFDALGATSAASEIGFARGRLVADLPGLEQKDIRVNVENGTLTIHGSREGEREAKEEDYYCCERWAGSFSRTITLPPGTDAENIKATFKNGVLEVHVPKSSKAAGKTIEVRAA